MTNKNVWLVGTGLMGIEYAKVLNYLHSDFLAIGRGSDNCKKFLDTVNIKPIEGGLTAFLKLNPALPEAVIVAVGVESLKNTTIELLNYGVKKILLEKPAVCHPSEISELTSLVKKKNATVLLAYNRRFYASVRKAKEIIEQDGGAISCIFDFTEWSHMIKNLHKLPEELETWFLGNSSHPIDTAFYLIGQPKEMSSIYKGSLDWHPSSSVFTGSGISDQGTLFSYHANWESPGRWNIEIMTKLHKLIFKPMEILQIQEIGSVVLKPVEIDDEIDKQFKPGFFLQLKAFLANDHQNFCDIYQQEWNMNTYYKKMSGYKN